QKSLAIGEKLDAHCKEFSQASIEQELVKSLNGLGDEYQALNQVEKSKPYYERALAISEKQRSGKGDARPYMAQDMIVSLIGLGNAAWAAGGTEQAQSCYKRAITLEQFAVISNDLRSQLQHGYARVLSSTALLENGRTATANSTLTGVGDTSKTVD